MRAKSIKVLIKYLQANTTDVDGTKLKSDLRNLKKKYSKLSKNEKRDFKVKLQDAT